MPLADVRSLRVARDDRSEEVEGAIEALDRLVTNPLLTRVEQGVCKAALQMLRDREDGPEAA